MTKSCQKMFAAVFLSLLLVGSLFTWAVSGVKVPQEPELPYNSLTRKAVYELYGGSAALLGKKGMRHLGVLKDRDSFLYSGDLYTALPGAERESAVQVRRLHDICQSQGVRLGVVQLPLRVPRDEARYLGLPYADLSHRADRFGRWCRYFGVPTLDADPKLAHQEMFSRTGSRMTPFGSLNAALTLVDQAEAAFEQPWPGGSWRDPDSYHSQLFENLLLGDLGQRSGRLFAGGLEDFQVFWPEDDGAYAVASRNFSDTHEPEGERFTKALLDLDENRIVSASDNAYLMYAGADSPYLNIQNFQQLNGPSVLVLGDSYSSQTALFLAPGCSRVDWLDMTQLEAPLTSETMGLTEYDYLFVAVQPENLDTLLSGIVLEESK